MKLEITNEERIMLTTSIDVKVAMLARATNSEKNAAIKELREKETQQYRSLANKLMTPELK